MGNRVMKSVSYSISVDAFAFPDGLSPICTGICNKPSSGKAKHHQAFAKGSAKQLWVLPNYQVNNTPLGFQMMVLHVIPSESAPNPQNVPENCLS